MREPATLPTHTIPYDSSDQALHATGSPVLASWKSRLTGAKLDWLLGDADGPFGRISVVKTDGSAVYIADALMRGLLMIEQQGTTVRKLVGEGDGPLEMRGIVGIVISDDGQIVLADATKLKVFQHIANDSLHNTATHWPGTGMLGVCAVGDRLYARILDPRDRRSVLSLSLADSSTFRFGTVPEASDESMHLIIGQGYIACTNDRVIVSYSGTPTIHGYDANGSEVWHTELEGFKLASWEQRTVAGTTASIKLHEPRDEILSVVALPPDAVLIQVIRLSLTDSGELLSYGIDSYIVEAEHGRGFYLGRSLPRVIAADLNRYWSTTLTAELVPQLRAFAY